MPTDAGYALLRADLGRLECFDLRRHPRLEPAGAFRVNDIPRGGLVQFSGDRAKFGFALLDIAGGDGLSYLADLVPHGTPHAAVTAATNDVLAKTLLGAIAVWHVGFESVARGGNGWK